MGLLGLAPHELDARANVGISYAPRSTQQITLGKQCSQVGGKCEAAYHARSEKHVCESRVHADI
jgi:hypothetical protein